MNNLCILNVNSLRKDVTMRKIDYEALTDDLIENYAPEENPELYSLYTSMKQHLMKVYKFKATTAHKFLVKIEERLGIHLYRNREMSQMTMINVKKGHDSKRYFRTLYWTTKLPLETVNEIYNKYNDISASIVKKFLLEKGQLTSEKFDKFAYSQKYYKEHREEFIKKKREYRARKKKENELYK